MIYMNIFSLENVIDNKRRSRMSTPQKLKDYSTNLTPSRGVTPSSRGVTPSRGSSRKRGGDHAETSVFEAESSGAESVVAGKRGSSIAKGNVKNSVYNSQEPGWF